MELVEINGQVVYLPEETDCSPNDVLSLIDTQFLSATAFIEGNIALVGRLGGEGQVVRQANGRLGFSRGIIRIAKICPCDETDCECRESGFDSPGERDAFEHLLDRIQGGD